MVILPASSNRYNDVDTSHSRDYHLKHVMPGTLLLMVCILSAGCAGGVSSTIEPEITLEEVEVIPTRVLGMNFPDTLDCSVVELTDHPGLQWNDLTLGISTRRDVEARLLRKNMWADPEHGSLIFYRPIARTDLSWDMVQACIKEDRLAALIVVGDPEFRGRLDRLIELYGKPDVVSWSNQYENRSVIWLRHGILIAMSIYNQSASYAVLFTPPSDAQLGDNWISQSLPTTMAPHLGDVGRLIQMEVENPWSECIAQMDCSEP
jgi:hypothetical protein